MILEVVSMVGKERLIKNPNIPGGKVSLALIDGSTRESVVSNLEKLGVRTIKTLKCTMLYEAVSSHPDMFIHHLGGGDIVAAPNAPSKTLEELSGFGFNIIKGHKTITGKYPDDIAYNVARIDNYVVCNTAHTDSVLLEYFRNSGIKLIDVKQGYSKCSTCIAGKGIIITSDEGIYKSLLPYDFEILKICSGFIELKGMDYGFIGGTSGLISDKKLAFAGNIEVHPDFDKILKFLSRNDIEIKIRSRSAARYRDNHTAQRI
jgi:hypothetical protein